MAVAPAPVIPSPGKLPGISVSDAFGLPDNWTLAESLKGMKATGTEKIEPEPEKGEGTPDPDEMEAQKAAEKAKAEEGATVDADKQAAEEAAAKTKEKTPAAAAPAKPAAGTTKTKAEPAKPAATPAKPAATPAAAAEPKKIKIGDKEYTEEELKKRLEQPATPAATPAAKTEPAKPAAAAPVKKEPTEAEKQAEAEKTQKIESEWIAGAAKTLAPAPVDETTMEKILTGGKDAVTEFDRIRREDMARTVLAVRKDLDQLYRPFFEAVTQMQSQSAAAEDQRVWTEFATSHPELANYEQVVKQHAQALVEADPAGVQAMSQTDFNAKVAELTIGYIRQFNPDFGKTAETPAGGAAPAAGAAAVTAAAKTLAAAKPAAGAEPAKRKTPAPPAATLPAGATAGGGKGGDKDFQKSAVASLM